MFSGIFGKQLRNVEFEFFYLKCYTEFQLLTFISTARFTESRFIWHFYLLSQKFDILTTTVRNGATNKRFFNLFYIFNYSLYGSICGMNEVHASNFNIVIVIQLRC